MCGVETPVSSLKVARVLHCRVVDKDIEIVVETIMTVTQVIIKIIDL